MLRGGKLAAALRGATGAGMPASVGIKGCALEGLIPLPDRLTQSRERRDDPARLGRRPMPVSSLLTTKRNGSRLPKRYRNLQSGAAAMAAGG